MLLASPLLGLLSATRATPVPSDAFYWSLRNATNAAGAPLSYEERALALAFQGIVNATEEPAVVKTLFFDVGGLDFDWPGITTHTWKSH